MPMDVQLIEVTLGPTVKAPVGIKVVYSDKPTEVISLNEVILRKILERYASPSDINSIVEAIPTLKDEGVITPEKLALDAKVRSFGEGWTTKKIFKMYVEDHYGI